MEIEDRTINELSDMLAKNINEKQVNLQVGAGMHPKGGKMVKYSIWISLKEAD